MTKRAVGAAFAVAPDGELVLQQNARFVGDVQPLLRRRSDAHAEGVPVHLLGDLHEEPSHPGLVPRQPAALRIAEEAVQGDARPAQVDDLAVEHRPAVRRAEAELAHAEAGCATVAAAARVEHVKERVVRAPEHGSGHGHGLRDRFLFAGRQGDFFPHGPADRLSALPRLQAMRNHGDPGRPGVRQPRLHEDRRVLNLRGHLDRLDCRQVGQKQRHAVVDARRPDRLFAVGPVEGPIRKDAGVRADADQEAILAAPVHGGGRVEPAGGKTSQMFADLLAVEPNGRAELRLVDDQHGGVPPGRGREGPLVPEVVPLLRRPPQGIALLRFRQYRVVLHREDELVRLVAVHVGKRRLGLVCQPRHGRFVIEARGNLLRPNALGHGPGSVQRQGRPLGGGRRRPAKCCNRGDKDRHCDSSKDHFRTPIVYRSTGR